MKKLVLILMVLVYSLGYSQPYEIWLDMPELAGLTPGETVVIPVTCDSIEIPHEISLFYIYVEWEDAVLDFVSAELSPEMVATLGMWNILFATGNSPGPGSLETMVGGWTNTVQTQVFSMNPGDVFFNITCTYVGDGSTVPGVGATPLNFQFVAKDEGGKLVKGVTEILDGEVPAGLFTIHIDDDPAGGCNLPGGEPPTDWTGLHPTLDNWNEEENWSAGVPTGLPDQVVTVDATVKAGPPVIYGSAVAGILNLVAGTLAIAPGGALTTTGLFTNNGLLYMSSDAAGVSATFIDQAGITGGGMWQFDRDVFCSGIGAQSNNPYGWHYLSSPLATPFTTDDLKDYFVNAYDETLLNTGDYWEQYALDPYLFPCQPWPTTPLNPMEAWSINFDPAYPDLVNCPGLPPGTGNIVEFMGVFNDVNTILPTPTATITPPPPTYPDYRGWNFFGNPYPSALNPSTFIWTGFANTTLQEGVAMYDGCAGNYIYSNFANGYSNDGGITPTNVGPTQGFFVKATTAGPFTLAPGMRVHDNNPSIYKEAVTSLVTIEATGDGTSDMAWIRFVEDAEAGMDTKDFPKMFATTEGLAQIYTTAGDEMLAANVLPETPVVPMGFTSATSGEYTISAIETSEFENVVLENRFTGEKTDLLTDSYTFNYTVGDDADRFFVHFTPLGIGDNLANSINIWSNDHKIYVQAPEIKGDIVVVNMMGQEVIRTEIEPGLNIIPVYDRNSYYVVKVVSNDIARTGKVYVK